MANYFAYVARSSPQPVEVEHDREGKGPQGFSSFNMKKFRYIQNVLFYI